MSNDKHTCDFEDSTAYICDDCYITGCGECLRDLGEARICGACWKKDEEEGRRAQRDAESALRLRNEAWMTSLGELPF